MIKGNLLREFEGDALETNVVAPLIQSLTLMNKFSVLPVYFMQFLISKSTYMPHIILTAYDDRDMVLSASKSVNHMNSVIYDKCPKTITPAAVVYPQEISLRDVIYNTSDDYWYSSSYVICGKELKDALSKKHIEFTNLQIFSDIQKREARVSIGWKSSVKKPEDGTIVELNVILAPISEAVDAIRLPLSNICKKINSFTSIINTIAKNVPTSFKSDDPDDATVINQLTANVKESQMLKVDKSEAKVFKDFVKQKPDSMLIWTDINDETDIRDVALNMCFKNNKNKIILLYRYIDNVVDSLSVNEG